MQLSIDSVVDLILQKFNIAGDDFIRAPRAGHPGWTNSYFIKLILVHGTSSAIVAAENCGTQTVYRALAVLVTPIVGKLHGGNETFRNKLQHLVQVKVCPKCKFLLTYDEYGIDHSSAYGVASCCKNCMSERNRAYYESNKDRYHKAYISEHAADFIARNAKRRAAKLNATPSWANLDLIKEIYKNAEGAHVDHIIPLINEYVCGLHVENNLQYLTPKENSKKSNKLLEQFTDSNFS